MVWEYFLDPGYADGVLFPDVDKDKVEEPSSGRLQYPLSGATVILCEAKKTLSHGLLGQVSTYRDMALSAGAEVTRDSRFGRARDSQYGGSRRANEFPLGHFTA